MKKILLATAALFCLTLAQAQLTGIELEEVMVHGDVDLTTPTGTVNLDGYTTYRLYATVESATDFVSAVYGDGAQITFVTTDGDMYQSAFGGATAADINCAFYDLDQSLVYDSWVTIGLEDNCTLGTVTAIGGNDDDDDFTTAFETTGSFELSGLTGGLWFTLNDAFELGLAGDDLKVLIGQFTTNGTLSGAVWIQAFIGGDGTNESVGNYTFSSNPGAVFGCTDAAALNYDALATDDDESCLFDCTLAIDGAVASSNPTCSYTNDGTITLDAINGQQFTDYEIVGETDVLAVGNFNGLGVGTYTVQITDAVCGNPAYPAFPAITVEVELATAAFEIDVAVLDDVSCLGYADGTLEGTFVGAADPVSFGLEAGVYTQDNLDFSGLDAGVVIVYGLDANGCQTQSNDVTVGSPFGFQLTGDSNQDASCFDTADGSILVNWNGGTGDNGEIQFSVDNIDFQTETFFGDLLPGDYTVYGLDANDCPSQIDITVNGPAEITLASEFVIVTCNGGADGEVSFGADGGNGGFTYSWMGGDFTAMTEYTDLAADFYTVDVMDSEGCTGAFDVEVTQPAAIAFEVVITDVSCNGLTDGSIEIINPAGGTPDYMYGINGADYDVSNIFTGLAAGDFMPGITDVEGCEITEAWSVAEPDAIEVSVTAVDETDGCDGSIDITPAGGTAPFDFAWNGPDGYTADTEDIVDLCGGDYFLSMVDDNGCTFEYDGAIEIIVGLEELENGVELSVYPNPSTGLVNLTLEGLAGQDVVYTLTDLTGRVIDVTELNATNGVFTQVIDMSGEANGTYMITLNIDGALKTVRIVKH